MGLYAKIFTDIPVYVLRLSTEDFKFYHRHLKIDNSVIRQHFLMKLCAYFTEYFRIKCTKFR